MILYFGIINVSDTSFMYFEAYAIIACGKLYKLL